MKERTGRRRQEEEDRKKKGQEVDTERKEKIRKSQERGDRKKGTGMKETIERATKEETGRRG
jgi:hypothetical protein